MDTKKKELTPTQKDFVNVLANYPNGATLLDIKLDTGKEFKTGSINCLAKAKIVAVSADKKAYECDIVYNGVVIGHTSKPYSVYTLIKA
jgi:hypothetical protein